MQAAFHKTLCLLLSLTVAAVSVTAQDKVRLIEAESAQLLEKNGESYRKVVGKPARFLHNDTYLLCDTALWNVNTNIIDAMGHVRIIQDRTQLSSATLQYVVDEDMARFRGDLVQLEDKDKNTLRTRYLDYNTKDSVAIFQDGGAMRDKDGQIIESLYGTYDSKAHLFVFNDQVNMFMDTTFIKTSRLEYRSDLSTAYFGYATDMWQDDNMLSANDGWYDRNRELFFFRKKVHLLTRDRETWSDSLYYYRDRGDVEMLGHVEVMDTTRNVYALAGRLEYLDSLSQATLTRDPAIMSVTEEEGGRPDSLYMGADILLYRAIKRCDIPESWIKDSEKRMSAIGGDPVMEYRRKAAQAAAKAAEEAAAKDPNRPPVKPQAAKQAMPAKPGKPDTPAAPVAPPVDSLVPPPVDSLAVPPVDSLAVPPVADTAAVAPAEPAEPPKDTTKVTFIWGDRHVRLFKRNMQMAGDSLAYGDLDSLIRVYKDPIVFNEGNKQYVSDSIYMVIRDKRVEKAHLLSNAFITIQEDTVSYDQVSGTEMVAYFDSTSALTRFDALGGASTVFYLEEEGALATVNKVECKMLYATFTDGEIDHLYYYDNPKNDGYPTVQLPNEERTLKGFRWEPERRPASPEDVTPLKPRRSERIQYLAHPHTTFRQTNQYFPGHVNKIYRDIAVRDSLQVARRRLQDSLAVKADSLAVQADSLHVVADTLGVAADSLKAAGDSLKVAADTLGVAADTLSARKPVLSERELKKKARQEAREARWAREDQIYEQKQAAKAQRKLERARKKKLRQLQRLEKKARKEQARFEKYLARERAKAAKKKNKTKQ